MLARITSLFALIAIFAAPAAFAQDAQFTDDEITAFANAYVDVEAIQAQYDAEAAEADDPEAAAEVQARYQEQINAAITARNLDVARYDAVIEAMQNDSELSDRVLAKVQEVRAERMGG